MPFLKLKFNIEFLDLTEQVSLEISDKYSSIGILATGKTIEQKLYNKVLKNIDIIYPTLKEQVIVSEIIIRVIRKQATEKDKLYLESIIYSLIKAGAQKVLLACTDLANLLNSKDELVFDTTDILIESVKRKMNGC